MHRLLFALVVGLVGAGIVHIAILFLLPQYSVRDAWSRISAVAAPFETVQLGRDAPSRDLPEPNNPFLQAAACRFDLSSGAVRVSAEGPVPFWSMSLFDRNGHNDFSISDTAERGQALDFLLLTPTAMQQMREQVPPGLEDTITIETGLGEGIALVRVFVPDETWDGLARSFLGGLRCDPIALPSQPPTAPMEPTTAPIPRFREPSE